MPHTPDSPHPTTSVEHWDERYSGEPVWSVHHEVTQDPEHRHEGFDPADFVGPSDVRELLAVSEGWEVVTDERRERQVEGGAGAHHHHDLVVRARRR